MHREGRGRKEGGGGEGKRQAQGGGGVEDTCLGELRGKKCGEVQTRSLFEQGSRNK